MPTLAGFTQFVQNVMGVGIGYLPPTSPSLVAAYNVALQIVNPAIQQVSCEMYDLAVYNLGGDNLINYATDASISNATLSWAGGVVTVTTNGAHGFTSGDGIAVSQAVPVGYNGAFQITVTGAGTYTYPLAANPGAYTLAGISTQTYFSALRALWKITAFVPGVIAGSEDVSTAETLLNPEFMKGLTMGNLQNLKTPFGRSYMAIAQDYGQLWGIS
jgi:hypothetical protein